MTSSNSGGLRLLGAVLLLAIGVAAALSLLVALGTLAPSQIFAEWEAGRVLLRHAATSTPVDRVSIAGLSAAIGLFSLTWLVRLLGGASTKAGVHLLAADEQGFVVVDSRGIAAIAAQAARSTKGVMNAKVKVSGVGTEPVRLKVDVGVHPGANIKEAGEHTRSRVYETVEKLVGVEVKDVSVSVHVMEAEELSRLLA
ncbi:MAG: hypothetical protein JRH20_02660 [Deltaproteobacteria bacterium]|nr:hypothetical protein [Deltaproteobacteria bacterium]